MLCCWLQYWDGNVFIFAWSFPFPGCTYYSFTSFFSSLTTGNYSSPRCHFFFQRQMESYLLTVYIPTVLLVSIAWLSFWIDAKAAPARVALGITTVLTVTTMTAGIQETLPVVTYAKVSLFLSHIAKKTGVLKNCIWPLKKTQQLISAISVVTKLCMVSHFLLLTNATD